MGIDSHRMFALAWGIGAACAGAAGALLSTFFPIFPEVGANFILIAFVVVNLGGFGSVAGAFWAGILVGVIEVMGGLLLGPQYKMAHRARAVPGGADVPPARPDGEGAMKRSTPSSWPRAPSSRWSLPLLSSRTPTGSTSRCSR